MKKYIFIFLILIIAGCVNIVEESNLNETEDVVIEEVDDGSIKITAKKWEFIPNTIEVNQGDNVVLKLESIDVLHGFALPAYDIDEKLELGQEVKIEFVADKVGEFEFYCNIPCGPGHAGMRGLLVVE